MQMQVLTTIKKTHALVFNYLIHEEVHKLMDCLFAEDMNERLQWYDIDLAYAVTGYRVAENDKKRWSHDLVLFIESLDDGREGELVKKDLKELGELILQITGLKTEE